MFFASAYVAPSHKLFSTVEACALGLSSNLLLTLARVLAWCWHMMISVDNETVEIWHSSLP
jgi:hypothetical protein